MGLRLGLGLIAGGDIGQGWGGVGGGYAGAVDDVGGAASDYEFGVGGFGVLPAFEEDVGGVGVGAGGEEVGDSVHHEEGAFEVADRKGVAQRVGIGSDVTRHVGEGRRLRWPQGISEVADECACSR